MYSINILSVYTLSPLQITSVDESCDMTGESSAGEMVKYVAERVTWTHQRRKRRLLDKLKSHELGT